MSEWREFTIRDFAEFLNSQRIPLSSTQRAEKKGEFPYYGASGIIDYVDDFLFEGEHVLVSEDGENLRSRKTPIAFKADGQFWVNNHAHILKGLKEHHNDLIVYYFQNLDLNPFLTGAVQPKLSKASLESIPFILPEDENLQKTIASALSGLDDKIDLLHRQNKTLEQMAETLYRQWFIEDAKENWEECSLYDAIVLVGGGTPKTTIDEYWNGDIKWLSGGDISTNHKSVITSSDKCISEQGLSNSSAKLLPKFSTIISARGTVGKYCILSEPMAFSQSNYGIKPKIDGCFFFTYLLVNHSVEELNSAAYGSVFDTITTDTFKGIEIRLPNPEEISEFEQTVNPYFQKILTNKLQIQTLEKLRDNLLPKLMSGEATITQDG